MNRRHFLYGSGAALASMGVSLPALAAAPSARKMIFVFAPGGWDATRVFAAEFANGAVAMEAQADKATAGDVSWVSHPDRPSVDAFFNNYRDRTVVFNGMLVRSIAHEICTMLTLTGTSSGVAPDWPAIVANADLAGYTLPHLVISGPSYPGNLGVAVARTGINGQLEALVSGAVEGWSAEPVQYPGQVAEDLIDRWLSRRAAARAASWRSTVEQQLTAQFADSMDKVSALKDLRFTMNFDASILLQDQARVAVDALANGISRCVTIAFAGVMGQGWDTHADNDAQQSPLWEDLFSGLLQLQALLESTPGSSAPTLADETLVVVMSEMNRTPALNALNGKDHWPYTSAMLIGPGLTGGRVVGAFDESYYGRTVDPASADVSDAGAVLSAESLGATLLAYADIDPADHVSGVEPITGVLA